MKIQKLDPLNRVTRIKIAYGCDSLSLGLKSHPVMKPSKTDFEMKTYKLLNKLHINVKYIKL